MKSIHKKTIRSQAQKFQKLAGRAPSEMRIKVDYWWTRIDVYNHHTRFKNGITDVSCVAILATMSDAKKAKFFREMVRTLKRSYWAESLGFVTQDFSVSEAVLSTTAFRMLVSDFVYKNRSFGGKRLESPVIADNGVKKWAVVTPVPDLEAPPTADVSSTAAKEEELTLIVDTPELLPFNTERNTSPWLQ